MAVIDTRNADIFIRDGTVLARYGAVNNVSGYLAADTVSTMLVEDFVGIVATGQSFMMVADTTHTIYKVTAHSETAGNTTSITFTPVLAHDVADEAIIELVAAVNQSSGTPTGYPLGTNQMTVDGFPDAVSNGQGFTINGAPELYTITAHDETTSKTTSITFTPGLTSSILDEAFIQLVGNLIEIKLGEGTLTYSEKRGVTYIINRGKIYTVKLADDAPVDIAFQFIWEFLRAASGDAPTVEEALRKINAAANWISSSPDPCEPYSVDIIICNLPPCPGQAEVITLNYFRHEDLNHDLKAGTVSVTGKANIAFAHVDRTG